MNIDDSAASYARRCILDLGLSANDTERAIIWCWDNPPKKPLPQGKGVRDKNVYISRRIWQCLYALAGTSPCVDGLVESILLQWMDSNTPELRAMYERHEQEIEMRLKELRHNEPDLQPQHCSSDIGEAE